MDHRDDSTFSFDPTNLSVKQLDKNFKKKIDSKKGVLLSSYTRKKTKRKKIRTKEAVAEDNLEHNSKTSNESSKSVPSRPTVLTIASSSSPSKGLPFSKTRDVGDAKSSIPVTLGEQDDRQRETSMQPRMLPYYLKVIYF